MSFGAPSEQLTDERTILAIGLAQAALTDPHSIHPSVWDTLKQHFSDVELTELCFIIGYYSGMHRAIVLLDSDINPDESTD